MTLRKLRLQARYNVLTPAALVGLSSAILLSAAPVLGATQISTGSVTSVQILTGNSFTNTGRIETDGTNPAVYSNGNIESFLNILGAQIIGDTYSGVAIDGNVNGSFVNNGSISSTDSYGVVVNGNVTSFSNTGSISGYDTAVRINGSVGNFTNTSSIESTSDYGVYIIGDVTGTFSNTKTISATNSYAVYITGAVNAFSNTGNIVSHYTGVTINGFVNSFMNSGNITADDDAGIELNGGVDSFLNTSTGVISGTWAGVYIGDGVNNFVNAGTISGSNEYGVQAYVSDGSFLNSGTISGANSYAGVYIIGSDNTLTNSGKISSATGYSVELHGADNTLKVLTGGTFIGAVWFGSNNTFDFSQYRGNMILDTDGSMPNVAPGDNLYLQTANQVIIVGDSSVTNSSHPVSDITNGINSLITDQLDFGTGGGGGDTGPLGFAPVRVNSAAEMATAKALAPKVKDGQVFWAQGTVGGSSNGVDASDAFGALVVGTHVQLQDGFRAGGLGGFAHSVATTDNSQTITAETGIIGGYGRADLDTVSLDFSILAGASTNASARTVAGPGGPETASATFGGWFIDPTVGVSVPVLSSDQGDLSLIGSVGYLFGGFGGYTETGSSANLTVGAQTIGILDAAFGVKGKKVLGSTEHGVIVGKGAAEIFAESNLGTSTVPIAIGGTTIGNALPPTALALGLRSTLSVEVPLSDTVSLTGGGSVSVRSDGLFAGAATAKISGTF